MVALDGGGLGLGGLRKKGTTGSGRADRHRLERDLARLPADARAFRSSRGRNFGAADRQGAPGVAIVNEHFAKAAWPGEDPIGQQLEFGDFRPGRESTISALTVVGVARDAKYRWIGEAPAPFIYVPYAQQPMREVNYFIRRAVAAARGASLLARRPPGAQGLRSEPAAGAPAVAARIRGSGPPAAAPRGVHGRRRSARSRSCWPASDCTASPRSPWPAARGKSACAWPSAPIGRASCAW